MQNEALHQTRQLAVHMQSALEAAEQCQRMTCHISGTEFVKVITDLEQALNSIKTQVEKIADYETEERYHRKVG